MIFAARGRRAECAQQLVALWLVACHEGPTVACVKLRAPGFEPFGSVSRRIDADRNEANVSSRFVTQLLLHAGESCAQRRADRRARSKDKIDDDRLTFNKNG